MYLFWGQPQTPLERQTIFVSKKTRKAGQPPQKMHEAAKCIGPGDFRVAYMVKEGDNLYALQKKKQRKTWHVKLVNLLSCGIKR